MIKNRRPEECGLFPMVQREDQNDLLQANGFIISQIVDFVKYVFVSMVRFTIILTLLFLVFVAPVLLGVFVKYLGFFN